MIIYKDIVTGDEMISDTYNLKDVDDVVYEVDCRMVTKGADNFNIGANPSAEEQEEAVDDTTQQVIDVVDGFRLRYLGDEASKSRAFTTKKAFQGQLKGYLKKVVEKLKEAGKDEDFIKKFQKGVQEYYTKHIVPNFSDLDFYAGESMDPDGMVVFLNYREDGITPYIIIWKHGLSEMKV